MGCERVPAEPDLPARVVVRGAGSIGRRHAGVFRDLGADVSVWPVRERHDATSDVQVLTDRSGPDACAGADLVVVATDTSRHVSDATLALDAGAQRLLVEKPVAPTAADALRLQRHEGASRVFVAAPLRAHRCFAELREPARAVGVTGRCPRLLPVVAPRLAPRPGLPRVLLRPCRRGRCPA